MIRTGAQYQDSIDDGRQVWIDGEKVTRVTDHPMFRPIVGARARIFDLAHEPASQAVMTYLDDQQDWQDKRAAVDLVQRDARAVVTRVGDETVGEMWSLFDGQDVLNEVDPQFSRTSSGTSSARSCEDPFHVSANTDPKGDRSKPPQEQDPDMLLHVVKETDNGIVVRGAKYETAAAYANQAFVKPTIANWGNDLAQRLRPRLHLRHGRAGLKFICRTGFAGRAPEADYPLANRADEVESLVIFDDVLIPWENVLFYRHTAAATFIRATLHRYSAFPFVQRNLQLADLMIGTALFNVKQTGLESSRRCRRSSPPGRLPRESTPT
jgi:4-hydroxyphenylacetate 3-monooxygenase